MPRNNSDIKILLDKMPKERWQAEILEKLDLKPLSFPKLAAEFGFEKKSHEYNALTIFVSGLQKKNSNIKPLLKSAFVEGEHVYPLYRTDQETELIKRGVISEEETEFDITTTAQEFDVRDGRFFFVLSNKER